MLILNVSWDVIVKFRNPFLAYQFNVLNIVNTFVFFTVDTFKSKCPQWEAGEEEVLWYQEVEWEEEALATQEGEYHRSIQQEDGRQAVVRQVSEYSPDFLEAQNIRRCVRLISMKYIWQWIRNISINRTSLKTTEYILIVEDLLICSKSSYINVITKKMSSQNDNGSCAWSTQKKVATGLWTDELIVLCNISSFI